jgi:hypothetical protein
MTKQLIERKALIEKITRAEKEKGVNRDDIVGEKKVSKKKMEKKLRRKTKVHKNEKPVFFYKVCRVTRLLYVHMLPQPSNIFQKLCRSIYKWFNLHPKSVKIMKYEGGVGEGGKGGKLDLITLAALNTGRNPGLSRQKHASANMYT